MPALARNHITDSFTRAANDDCINGGSCTRTKYTYDEQGHILEECGPWISPNTSCIDANSQFFVWLGDIPVGTLLFTINSNPTTGDITSEYEELLYVHADNLNTPRYLSHPSDTTNAPAWSWDSDPFGVGTRNGDPRTTGTYYVYDLGFPGQVFDSETGLSQNYFRDYDPMVGRYVESDPIGLRGGSYSTYVYVADNPISHSDKFGLCDGTWHVAGETILTAVSVDLQGKGKGKKLDDKEFVGPLCRCFWLCEPCRGSAVYGDVNSLPSTLGDTLVIYTGSSMDYRCLCPKPKDPETGCHACYIDSRF